MPPARNPGPGASHAAVTATILGHEPKYTRREVAAISGVPIEHLIDLWRALGFPSAPDEDAIFTDGDIEAIAALPRLLAPANLAMGEELAVVRTLGRTFSRLAEWEVSLLAGSLAGLPPDQINAGVAELMPTIQHLQDYAWRRHLAGAAGRALLSGPIDGTDLAVGFVDMVGFTRTSRRLTQAELGHLVERFESTASTLVASRGGRVIKTIGDEILFVTDTAPDAAYVALELTALHLRDPSFPEVRGGLAHGPVLARLGDVFGETVNIASRLTSLARPGTVLANPELAYLVSDQMAVRRLPAERVRGYSRLEAWVLRPAEVNAATP